MSWIAIGGTVLGLGMGAVKNKKAKQVEDSDRKLASETQRFSPWTGMKAGEIRNANSEFGDIVGGGLSGLGTAQSMQGLFKPTPTAGANIMSGIDPKVQKPKSIYGLEDETMIG